MAHSQGIQYGFGQLGSGFTDETGAFTPPAGKVIVAITFLEETTLAGLVADTGIADSAYFSHTSAIAANGGNAAETDAGTKFPKGVTIYGRWTSVTLSGASSEGGIICYFGS
tara:strand:+ start:2184 stop:2519 length:336 start_codon:yes stop_codon:yes gene_type:complete